MLFIERERCEDRWMDAPATSAADPVEAPTRTRLRTGGRILGRVATHPLVLLAAGAAVSGLLVPALTRGAQNHKQTLEIRSDLVTSMTEATAPFLAATLANVLVYHGNVPRSYDVAYETWYAHANEVLTKLETYDRDAQITQRWGPFTFRVRDLYYLFRLSGPAEVKSGVRTAYVDRLRGFVRTVSTCRNGTLCPQVRFDLIDRWLAKPSRGYEDAVDISVEQLLLAFRVELADIVQETLALNPRL
jgi:hypothetical protein